jgi:hypothetical protein
MSTAFRFHFKRYSTELRLCRPWMISMHAGDRCSRHSLSMTHQGVFPNPHLSHFHNDMI